MSQNPISIVTAEHVGEYRLKLSFDDGKDQVVEAIAFVKERGVEYMDLYGRKLVDSALTVLIGHLLLCQAKDNERKKVVAKRFIDTGLPTLQRDLALLSTGDMTVLESYDTLAGPVPVAEA